MRGSDRNSALAILLGAGALRTVFWIGSLGVTAGGRASIVSTAGEVVVATGVRRRREPQAGDHWGGCDDARAAGTAPIYEGEPRYRAGMDGDGDGIACEPYRP